MTPREKDTPIPEFTQTKTGEASEDSMDEKEIIEDQDVTHKSSVRTDDENMGAKSMSYEFMEDEPGDFMRGEIDVKEQMDRAADALDASLHGYQNQGAEDSPRTEIGSSFKYTPGGIEEVEAKTDQYLATHKKPKNNKAGGDGRTVSGTQTEKKGHTGKPGHETGAFTDIGAGKSGVTRKVSSKEKSHLR
ncbi:MAG: hypothetical protein ACXVCY_07980 [Pseudobdellovibrionaceae bacterium]